jgi:hypothetical protein
MCLGHRPKALAGETPMALFMWSSSVAGRSYSLRAVATLLERGRTETMDSNTPTKRRTV